MRTLAVASRVLKLKPTHPAALLSRPSHLFSLASPGMLGTLRQKYTFADGRKEPGQGTKAANNLNIDIKRQEDELQSNMEALVR